jgi:hypothetical protein
MGRDVLPLDASINVREPCGLFRQEILASSQRITSTSGFMPSFLRFVEANVQIQLSGVYDPNFFTGAFLCALLLVESWMVSDNILPANVPPTTFHVYRLVYKNLQAIRSCYQWWAYPFWKPNRLIC